MRQLILLAAILLTAVGARSQTPETKTPLLDYAQTQGTYEKEYDPDEIYLSITIQEKDSKGKISIEEQQQALLETLVANGIDPSKSLQIKELSSNYYKKGQNMAYGRYELKLTSLKEFYTIYIALDELGLSDVSIDRIDRSDREQLILEVLTEAMKNARSKAEAIAAADGLKVSRCFYFNDNTEDKYKVDRYTLSSVIGSIPNGRKEAFSFPKIGTVKISATVNAKFWLE